MKFCRSGDITSGFVAIKNGIEYCYFDMLAIVTIVSILLSLVIIIYYKSREKRKYKLKDWRMEND